MRRGKKKECERFRRRVGEEMRGRESEAEKGGGRVGGCVRVKLNKNGRVAREGERKGRKEENVREESKGK